MTLSILGVTATVDLANSQGTLGISNGGTGQATANGAVNALLPTQSGQSGKFLTTDGTDTSWTAAGAFTTLTASGNFAVATNKFTVTAASGNTAVAGTLTAAGLFYQSSVSALTAAGTTRTDALVLTKQLNNLTTVASGTGVTLPAATAGAMIAVFNGGANPVQVYGAGTDTIDGVAAATGVPLTNAKRCLFICFATGSWISAQLGVVAA